jgi:hypothetical protein
MGKTETAQLKIVLSYELTDGKILVGLSAGWG